MELENRSVARAVTLIEYISNASEPVTLHQIAIRTKLDKATIKRLINTLLSRNWIYRRINDGCYCLGYKLAGIGASLSKNGVLAQLAAPEMHKIFQKTGCPSDLAVFDGQCMEIIESTRRLSDCIEHKGILGLRVNLFDSAIGRAYLAAIDPLSLDNVFAYFGGKFKSDIGIKYNEASIKKLLSHVQLNGYAVREPLYNGGIDDHETEISESIAVPITLQGKVVACMNLVYLNIHNDELLRLKKFNMLKNSADNISKTLQVYSESLMLK
ncbi:hypothetical protein C0J08_14240 [Marinomonas sp. CT5]|uniref:IclR family transcriptional regulator n=1 Tax=Marinomonas sp. CT5 TaxID=2066133 RepID=UPI001BAE8953|nr:helix-turn-helix domain-containing protein [Marinomonas sp. CT5]QUX96487.1 hypothetical protein C0J08_14240 [Marinomonas sp. CT5]